MYLQQFEEPIVQSVVDGRHVYYEFLTMYCQSRDQDIHKEHPDLFEIDSTKILEQHQILLFLRGKFVEFIKQKM